MQLVAVAGGLAAGQASATWSILLVDLRTGEIAIGSATCLANFDLRANTPVLIPGVGGAAAQSFVDTTGQNRTLIRDGLAEGLTTEQILANLSSFDPGHQSRQYGIVSVHGGVTTFTGTGAGEYRGGVTGVLVGAGIGGGDIAYAIQGNVLTGDPVISQALAAVTNTPGDLAEKLMAGMEAARAMGGDGRCSCMTGAPTACGSPPASFEKSAHIGYMLVARAGDVEGCAPTYRLANTANDIVAETVDGVPAGRLALTNSSSNGIEILPVLHGPTPAALGPSTIVPIPEPGTKVIFEDLNGDQLADLAMLSDAGDVDTSVWIRFADPGSPTGFADAFPRPLGSDLRDLVVADVDDDGLSDLVAVDASAGEAIIAWGADRNTFVETTQVFVGSDPVAVQAVDVNEDGSVDLVVLTQTDARVLVFEQQGHHSFVAGEILDTGLDLPMYLETADTSLDGRVDFLVAGVAPTLRHILRRPDGTSQESNYPVGGPIRGLDVGDFNKDGRPDVLALSFLHSTAALAFDFLPDLLIPTPFLTPGNASAMTLADLDGDGDKDLAYVASAWRSVRLVEQREHELAPATGCASGSYFLNLNVPFVDVSDPDPILTLRSQFDQWRSDHVGVVDAVVSTAELDDDLLGTSPACRQELTISLRDFSGDAVAGLDASAIHVEHAPGSDEASAIGDVTDLGNGSYRVLISGAGLTGHDRLRVVVMQAENDPVELMPTLSLDVDDLADLDEDGDRDSDDFALWMQFYSDGNLRADQNRDGLIDSSDFSAWILNATTVCP